MTERATRLLQTADQQLSELYALITAGGEPLLRRPCAGREKLGDGTVAAVAAHAADTYVRMGALIGDSSQAAHDSAADHDDPHAAPRPELRQLLDKFSAARDATALLGTLTEQQLDTVPPAGQARFCDGQRTLEQVLGSMLRHQQHQIEAVKAAA
jgi:hypothetical protein